MWSCDHVIYNAIGDKYETIVLVSQISEISDHFPILHFKNFVKQFLNLNLKYHEFFWTSMLNWMTGCLEQCNLNEWSPMLLLQFCGPIFFSADTHIPPVTKKFNHNFHNLEPWMSKGLLPSRRTKINLGKTLFTEPSAESLGTYKTYRNPLLNLLELIRPTGTLCWISWNL